MNPLNNIPSEIKQDETSESQELELVVLGERNSEEIPRARLLKGRRPSRFFILPAMTAIIIAGIIAVIFTLQHNEWSPWAIATTWFVLYVWTWFYGVAFKYRRTLLWWSSTFSIMTLSSAIAFFCIDKASAQLALAPGGLALRESVFSLWISAILTIIAASFILSHFVFFGRGYREKKV